MFMVLVLFGAEARSTDFFVSSAGNDSTSHSTEQTPWKSIDKINAMMPTFRPGDRILFKRGETFNGTLNVTQSGAEGNPIHFSAYGTDPTLPVITGSAPVTQWVNVGGQIWKAHHDNKSLGDVGGVFIDGKLQEIGRSPDRVGQIGEININGGTGYHSINSRMMVNDSSFADPGLGGVNFVGAEIVSKHTPYSRATYVVESQSGNSVTLNKKWQANVVVGYLITKHRNTLSRDGEWYFDKLVDTLYVYSDSDPNLRRIEATNRDRLVYGRAVNHVVFSGLAFRNSQVSGLVFEGCRGIRVESCLLENQVKNAVRLAKSRNSIVQNCSFLSNSGHGVSTDGTSGMVIRRNSFKRHGIVLSMGDGLPLDLRRDTAMLVEENAIDSCGYNGIYVKSSVNSTVQKNLVTHWNLVFTDGGALYTHYEHENLKIHRNIFVDGLVGGNECLPTTGWASQTRGLYFDGSTHGVDVRDNFVANAGDIAHTQGNMWDVTEIGNTYVATADGGIASGFGDPGDSAKVALNVHRKNIYFSPNLNWPVVRSTVADFSRHVADSNFYISPFLSDNYLAAGVNAYDMASWSRTTGSDVHSQGAPHYIQPYVRDSANQPNRVVNSGLDIDAHGWVVDSVLDPWVGNGMGDGGALSTFNGRNAYTHVGKIVAGKLYACRFSSYGYGWPGGTQISLLGGNGRSIATASEGVMVNKNTRRDGVVFFTATANSDSARLRISRTRLDSSMLDNVEFFEISSIINRADLWMFDYNASDEIKTIPLPAGTYVDAKGKTYAGSTTVEPWGSLVLVRSSLTTGTVVSKIPATGIRITRNARGSYLIDFGKSGVSHGIEVIASNGSRAGVWNTSDLSFPLDLSGWAKGVYWVRITEDGNVLQTRAVPGY